MVWIRSVNFASLSQSLATGGGFLPILFSQLLQVVLVLNALQER
jgi:hypothetical protein